MVSDYFHCLKDKPHIFLERGKWTYRYYASFGEGCPMWRRTMAGNFCARMNSRSGTRQVLDGTAFERGAEPTDGRAPGGSL